MTNECTICTDCILYPELVSTKCGHTFHRKCLNKWLNKNNVCPNCRTEEPWNEFKKIIKCKCTCGNIVYRIRPCINGSVLLALDTIWIQ